MKSEDVVKLETEIDLLAFHVVLRPNPSGTFGFYYQSVCKLPVKHADTLPRVYSVILQTPSPDFSVFF